MKATQTEEVEEEVADGGEGVGGQFDNAKNLRS